jgi:hypothetical protein
VIFILTIRTLEAEKEGKKVQVGLGGPTESKFF